MKISVFELFLISSSKFIYFLLNNLVLINNYIIIFMNKSIINAYTFFSFCTIKKILIDLISFVICN